ncbi:MAG: hypothetical protein AUH46_01225 [Gemmatimonadetes bacterium 13_1_40CM_70_15]|nr:MAG: hypothetical protein AUH46_01225 [Gemmatimonadetes bacterium 13_1_40CM_70_15]
MADALTPLRSRVAQDSGDAEAWFQLGQGYLRWSVTYHLHRAPAAAGAGGGRRGGDDTAWARAILDTADEAFARVATLRAGTAAGDSARVLRVFAWGERAFLAWELEGSAAAARTWSLSPTDAKLPPVLQELGENLLRACPRQAVLLTAEPASTHAAWFMRFARVLRQDVVVFPLAVWATDSVFRRAVLHELKLSRPGRAPDASFGPVSARRPLCASMGFDRPPELRPRVSWKTRPLVWAGGPGAGNNPVPPQDFVFAALKLALDANDTWARPAIVLYRRAAALTPALCRTITGYQVPKEKVGCR